MLRPIGHDHSLDGFALSFSKGRLGGTFLLVGPPGIGKADLARWIAAAIFCPHRAPRSFEPCTRCESCLQVAAGTHPDLVEVAKPEDKASIPLDLLIGPPDARMRQGFCRDIRLKPQRGTRKVAILHDADFLAEEGANSLLKTFEEPPPDAIIFVIATNEQRQLPTIRSRCQIVRMMPPRGDDAAAILRRHGVSCDPKAAESAIELCGGDCLAAADILREDQGGLQPGLGKTLGEEPLSVVTLAALVTDFVEEAGDSAPRRRDRMRDVFSFAVQFYREQMRQAAGNPDRLTPILYRLDRCIDALGEVQRNANQAILIESWSADLARGRSA